MRLTIPFFLTALATFKLATADFFVSNTSVCMGAFPVHNCYHGAKVLTDATDFNKTYTCPHLVPAEDDHYIRNGTAGPFGDDNLISDGGICDSGKLYFEHAYVTGVKSNETGYSVKDAGGKPVAECVWDQSADRQCNQWVGMLYFATRSSLPPPECLPPLQTIATLAGSSACVSVRVASQAVSQYMPQQVGELGTPLPMHATCLIKSQAPKPISALDILTTDITINYSGHPPRFDTQFASGQHGEEDPGQERKIPQHDKTGKAPFHYPTNGMKGETCYWIWGDLSSKKTPLICLHGGPGVPHNYLLPIAHIYADCGIPVIMYDQIGVGESSRFRDKKGDHEFWTPQLFMAELDNLKEHLDVETFDLLGQSWGGMLAGQYAIEKQPKGLRKLIIADSPSDMKTWVEVSHRLRKELPKDVRETLERCERDDKTDTSEYEEAVMYFYHLHICRLEPWPKELNDSFAGLEEDNTVYYTMNGPSEFCVIGNLKKWNITEELKKITKETAPGGVLVVNGYYDEAQDETTDAYWKNPSARTKWIRYPLSSHMPMLEETERFLADLGRFLKSE